MRSPGSKVRALPLPKRQSNPEILENVSESQPQPSTSKKRKRVEVGRENVEGPDVDEKENDPRPPKKSCVESRNHQTRTRGALQRKSASAAASSIKDTAHIRPGPSRIQPTVPLTVLSLPSLVRPAVSTTVLSLPSLVRPAVSTTCLSLPSLVNTLPNNETQMDTATSTSTSTSTTSGQAQRRNPRSLEEFRYDRSLRSMIESMEQELCCTICREIYVESSVLACGHTFCGFCISKWFENSMSCPICRSAQSTSPIKHIQLDNYLVKVHSFMTTDRQARREALIQERRAEMERSRRIVSTSRPLIVTPGHRYTFERHLNQRFQPISPPGVTNNNRPPPPDTLLLTPRVRVQVPNMAVNALDLTPDSFASAVSLLLGGNSGNIHVEFIG